MIPGPLIGPLYCEGRRGVRIGRFEIQAEESTNLRLKKSVVVCNWKPKMGRDLGKA